MKKISVVVLSLLMVVSCGKETKYQYVTLNPINVFNVEDIVREEKNYAVNKIHNVYVGEAIVRKKTFLDKVQSELVARPLVDATLRSGELVIDLIAEQEYPVTHRVNLGGRPHYVAEVYHPVEKHVFGIMLSEGGDVHPRTLNGDILLKRHFSIMPLTARVETEHKKTLMSSQLMDNFEIVFGGINENQMSFTYREYTAEDVAKTAFFQNLTYPANAKVIRFKALKIKIHDVTSESVTYEVLEE